VREGDHLGQLDTNERIILKRIFQKYKRRHGLDSYRDM
jgi:hypothetical protein